MTPVPDHSLPPIGVDFPSKSLQKKATVTVYHNGVAQGSATVTLFGP